MTAFILSIIAGMRAGMRACMAPWPLLQYAFLFIWQGSSGVGLRYGLARNGYPVCLVARGRAWSRTRLHPCFTQAP